ncbi:MAG: hypothetical protein RLZZ54_2191 [Cyanobacteriota bacterium]
MDLLADLLVFDAVQGLESTLDAAALLQTPQSSVSRRYRQFAQGLRLQLSRQSGSYKVVQGQCVLQQMRQFAQRFRFLHQLNRWAVHPALSTWVNQTVQDLPGLRLPLEPDHWERWLDQRLIDQVLDCRLLNSSEPLPATSHLHLTLVADPAAVETHTLILGEWSTVEGLETAVQAAGWTVAPPHAASVSNQATLIAVPSQQPLAQTGPSVVELVLQWRYGPMLQQLDPLADTQRQQFERLIAMALGSAAGAEADRQTVISELDLSGLLLN